ncbi:formate hydrogenlyase subunit 6/NADH:ubiquinone oxidoreductase subunit I [Desulfohalotomaculum tongense]|uniref:4Fe-4S dicluster domain-containing protein n=1 Tax=Desulforadius tongensis TaxID=1216062 RepID=UPI0019599B29|nr:4Fe-4S dicluster domain-containing protein [Desulforadius tongensis]MBM7856202.1 formate hydrogenlyase subunit 6/NADH:ubiquinone oxidoreductase subunit I [Desulforadius tongensis]
MIINKSEIAGLLDNLVKEYRVYAPVEKDGSIVFEAIEEGARAKLGTTSKKPAKEILFPQSEELFSYQVDSEGLRMEDKIDDTKSIAFGVRPCDAKSMMLLDNVFHNDLYEDVYYTTRRKNTIIVSVGCSEPESTCFCSSVNSGPFDTDGSDVMLTDLGEAYLAEAVTEQGKEFLLKLNLKEAGEEDKARAEEIKSRAQAGSEVDITGLKEKLDGMFDHPYWDKLHEKCLGCAACTYLCPTCHCFDIADEARDCNGCRVRNWDSCMFPLFTLHGSGHNPRTSGKERWRQRVMHKFNYFVERYNATACVGCGRCIKNCPVNMDIRQVLAEIKAQDTGSEVS